MPPTRKPYHPPANQPLDPELYQQASRITFITLRAYQRFCPFADPVRCQMVVETLREEQSRSRCSIFTYCLMPDHLHFLISPQLDGVSVLSFTAQYKGKTTRLAWELGWQGKLWQPRCYDHLVRDAEGLQAVATYILENPVRKGYVSRAEAWAWSGEMNPLPG